MATELETERLTLRAWREEDWRSLAVFFAEPESTNIMGGVSDAGFAWRVIACHVGHWQWRGFGMWAVEHKDDAALAGFCGPWYPADWPEIELGWSLLAAYRGQGLATEAASAARRWVYREVQKTPLVSFIEPNNKPSIAVAERLGCRHEGKTALPNGRPALAFRHPAPEAVQ